MFLKRADHYLERKILNRYPLLSGFLAESKVYFMLHNDGTHVFEPNGNVKCLIMDDSELHQYLKTHPQLEVKLHFKRPKLNTN